VDLAALHQPDVVLLDISMPTLDGIEALPLIREASPRSRVVLLSGDVNRIDVDDADGVLEKGLAPHRLVRMLLEVVEHPKRELGDRR
jgi:DNA-binding NarL/FixJ family response regulator